MALHFWLTIVGLLALMLLRRRRRGFVLLVILVEAVSFFVHAYLVALGLFCVAFLVWVIDLVGSLFALPFRQDRRRMSQI